MNCELKRDQDQRTWATKGAASAEPFPEVIEVCLEEGFAICCAFNGTGTLLATGCNDGSIVLWDFAMRLCSKILLGHCGPVTSLSWDTSGKLLASGSADWQVFVWDVVPGRRVFQYQCQSPVLSVQFNPSSNDQVLVCSLLCPPTLLTISARTSTPIIPAYDHPTPQAQKDRNSDDEGDSTGAENSSRGDRSDGGSAREGPPRKKKKTDTESGVGSERDSRGDSTLYHNHDIAAFEPSGKRIFAAGGNGDVMAIELSTMAVVLVVRTAAGTKIKSIRFSSDGSILLVNTSDRVLRTFSTHDGSMQQAFQDKVGRLNWVTCTLGVGSHFLVAAPSGAQLHRLFIWDAPSGLLLRVLQGPSEGVLDVAWHPTQVAVVSVSTAGIVYVWVAKYTDSWSNFDPKFTELENNMVYEEREDEFDEKPEEQKTPRTLTSTDESKPVDVVSILKLSEGGDIPPGGNQTISVADLQNISEGKDAIQARNEADNTEQNSKDSPRRKDEVQFRDIEISSQPDGVNLGPPMIVMDIPNEISDRETADALEAIGRAFVARKLGTTTDATPKKSKMI